MTLIYIKTTLTIPGVGDMTHLAELEHQVGSPLCTPSRMLEVQGNTVTGAFRRTPALNIGMSNPPQQLIPHPDTWGDMPDIVSEALTAEEFEAMWVEAEVLLG